MSIDNNDNLKSGPSLINSSDALRSEIIKDLSILKDIVGNKGKDSFKKLADNFHLLSNQELQSISGSLKVTGEKDKRISQSGIMNMAKFIGESDNPNSALDNLKLT